MFVNTRAGQPVLFTLDATDPEGNPLQYIIDSPTSGTLEGYPPDLTYVPNPGFSGTDQFMFSVSDGLLSSPPAFVFINVEANAVTLDGDLTDWAGVAPIASDPADSAEVVDILALYARATDERLYLALENESPISQLNYGYSWYLDTDQDAQTGFAMFSIGADYLLEGSLLYRFAGTTQGAWVWTAVGSVSTAMQGNAVEYELDPAQLDGSSAFDLIFWGPSSAFGGSSVDLVPNAGFVRFSEGTPGGPRAISIDGDFSDWPADSYRLEDGDDLPGVNPVDILEVRMAVRDNKLYLGYLNETPLPVLDWTYTLYLDTDFDAATGFETEGQGGDYMIQDAGLYRYSGNGSDWTWSLVKSLRLALNNAQVEIEVPLSDLGSPSTFRFECVGENIALGSSDGVDFAIGQFQVVAPEPFHAEVSGSRPTDEKRQTASPSGSVRSADVRRKIQQSKTEKGR